MCAPYFCFKFLALVLHNSHIQFPQLATQRCLYPKQALNWGLTALKFITKKKCCKIRNGSWCKGRTKNKVKFVSTKLEAEVINTNAPPISVDLISIPAATSMYNASNKVLLWMVAINTAESWTFPSLYSPFFVNDVCWKQKTAVLPEKSHTSWTQAQTVEWLGYLMCRITW